MVSIYLGTNKDTIMTSSTNKYEKVSGVAWRHKHSPKNPVRRTGDDISLVEDAVGSCHFSCGGWK